PQARRECPAVRSACVRDSIERQPRRADLRVEPVESRQYCHAGRTPDGRGQRSPSTPVRHRPWSRSHPTRIPWCTSYISTAGSARERGIKTVVVGRPMEFWRENMPEGMFLRSGPDWHMDGAGTHTMAAFLEDRGIATKDIDPIPIAVFLDYAEWFREQKPIDVQAETVADLTHS